MRVNKTKPHPKTSRFEQRFAAKTYDELVNGVMPNRHRRRKLAAEARRKKTRGPQVSNVGQGTEIFWHR